MSDQKINNSEYQSRMQRIREVARMLVEPGVTMSVNWDETPNPIDPPEPKEIASCMYALLSLVDAASDSIVFEPRCPFCHHIPEVVNGVPTAYHAEDCYYMLIMARKATPEERAYYGALYGDVTHQQRSESRYGRTIPTDDE